MALDGVLVRAANLNGSCMLLVAGELDTMAADSFAGHARAALRAVPGPVLVDLSGLTFIDAHGARALDELLRTLPDGRAAAVRRCPLRVRRVLNRLGLDPSRCPAGERAFPPPAAPSVAGLVRRARLEAARSRQDASGTLTQLTDTCIRLASTIERAGLLREQGRQALASSTSARRHRTVSRDGAGLS